MFGRILVIDDDEALLESLQITLSQEGYEVSTSACAEDALDRITTSTVDAVLCDLRVPGLEGFDLLPQLARELPGAPIILMSSDL